MKKIFSIFLCFLYVAAQAQQTAIRQTITNLENKGASFRSFPLFAVQGIRQNEQLGIYTALQLDRTVINTLYAEKPEQIDISLPADGAVWQLRFTRSHILSDTKFIIADATGEHTDTTYVPGVFYHGIIKNVSGNSFATATVFNGSIHLFVSYNGKNVQVGAINDKHPDVNSYGVFNQLPGNNDPVPFTCGTTDNKLSTAATTTLYQTLSAQSTATGNRLQAYTGRVVRCFFDCSFTYYQHYVTTAACYNRITTIFNQTALCYANESINMAIAEIRIWTSADPYDHSTRTNGRNSFKDYVRNNYTGNIAMLCDWQGGISGIADGFGLLCQPWVNAATPGPYIYNDMNYNNTFYNFPVGADAPQTYLMIHEMGHILGSVHTQNCGWPGGPIDNCAAVEGSCSPGPTPSQGTMMSYCCTSSIGIDFNAGFGPLPGNVIRNHVNTVACLSNGATICDSSLYLQGSITNSDYTTFEASNTITTRTVLSTAANVVFDGGRKVELMPGFFAPQGSTLQVVNEGCGGFYRQAVITQPKK